MKKAASINQEITKLQKELEKVQDDCNHKEKQIKMNKKGDAMWTCEDCEKRLTYPSTTEMEEWMNK